MLELKGLYAKFTNIEIEITLKVLGKLEIDFKKYEDSKQYYHNNE